MNNHNYKVIGIHKKTAKKIVIEAERTREQAIKSCEEWGWVYDDGKESYYMSIEKECCMDTFPLAMIVESIF